MWMHTHACGIIPHRHKRTVYAAMRPYFKTMVNPMVPECGTKTLFQ
jgi:hypothetical protein